MSSDIEFWPPPDDPAAFESLCLDLWSEVWGPDSGAQKNGRSGQLQAGVDVFGRNGSAWIGVQCKQKSGLLRSGLTVAELEQEVERALKFTPPLGLFIVATTGPRDAAVQRRAREITLDNETQGRFPVEVWSWSEIWHEIYRRPGLLERLLPIYWPKATNAATKRSASSVSLGALALWQQKLDFLRVEEPKTVDPDQKFRLRLLIAEAEEKIRNLRDPNGSL